MLALRRCSRRSLAPLVRGNATLQVSNQSADATAAPPLSNNATEKSSTQAAADESSAKGPYTRPTYPRRPRLSPQNPREWNRPLAYGVLPAFDEALKFLKADSAVLKEQAKALEAEIEGLKKEGADADAVKELERELEELEVQSEINFPEVRWKVANGMADMSRAVERRLVENRWRKEGALDLLMERIHQMSVVPDVLPDLHPSVDLRLTYPEEGYQKHVEPGVYLTAEQTRNAPKVYTTVFHAEERLYTLLMVDPDVPDETNATFQNYVHWLQPNISLKATSSPLLSISEVHTPYTPPHPQKGTRYHRYTTMLLPQKSQIDVPKLTDEMRLGFNVREFLQKYDLDPSTGGGAHMFREVWSEGVSSIYKDILGVEEPKFGHPPKHNPYAELKYRKRYV